MRPLFLDILRRKQHAHSFSNASKAGHSEDMVPDAIEEASLYVSLLQICLEAKIPMQFIEVFGGLIFSSKLSDIGTWSDRNRKMSEWNSIAKHFVTAFLHCTSGYKMLFLALDDVCGLDEMSWKILHHLYAQARNLVVVCAARSEFDLNINAEYWDTLNGEGIESGRFRHLRLSPMNEEDMQELACCRLGKTTYELDSNISRTVHAQSRGNPLLACEILDTMYKDDGAIASGEVIGRIGELLLNCLDELSPAVRSHLNLGATMGYSFKEKDVIVVMEKYNNTEGESKARQAALTHSNLQEAVRAGILKYSDRGEVTYTFSHSLWMKTIELNILDAWKAEMHVLIEALRKDERTTLIDESREHGLARLSHALEDTQTGIDTCTDNIGAIIRNRINHAVDYRVQWFRKRSSTTKKGNKRRKPHKQRRRRKQRQRRRRK